MGNKKSMNQSGEKVEEKIHWMPIPNWAYHDDLYLADENKESFDQDRSDNWIEPMIEYENRDKAFPAELIVQNQKTVYPQFLQCYHLSAIFTQDGYVSNVIQKEVKSCEQYLKDGAREFGYLDKNGRFHGVTKRRYVYGRAEEEYLNLRSKLVWKLLPFFNGDPLTMYKSLNDIIVLPWRNHAPMIGLQTLWSENDNPSYLQRHLHRHARLHETGRILSTIQLDEIQLDKTPCPKEKCQPFRMRLNKLTSRMEGIASNGHVYGEEQREFVKKLKSLYKLKSN